MKIIIEIYEKFALAIQIMNNDKNYDDPCREYLAYQLTDPSDNWLVAYKKWQNSNPLQISALFREMFLRLIV